MGIHMLEVRGKAAIWMAFAFNFERIDAARRKSRQPRHARWWKAIVAQNDANHAYGSESEGFRRLSIDRGWPMTQKSDHLLISITRHPEWDSSNTPLLLL